MLSDEADSVFLDVLVSVIVSAVSVVVEGTNGVVAEVVLDATDVFDISVGIIGNVFDIFVMDVVDNVLVDISGVSDGVIGELVVVIIGLGVFTVELDEVSVVDIVVVVDVDVVVLVVVVVVVVVDMH